MAAKAPVPEPVSGCRMRRRTAPACSSSAVGQSSPSAVFIGRPTIVLGRCGSLSRCALYTVCPLRPDMKLSNQPIAAITRRTTPTHSSQFRACEKPPTKRRTIATTPAMIRSVFMVSTFLSGGIRKESCGFLTMHSYLLLRLLGSVPPPPSTFYRYHFRPSPRGEVRQM